MEKFKEILRMREREREKVREISWSTNPEIFLEKTKEKIPDCVVETDRIFFRLLECSSSR